MASLSQGRTSAAQCGLFIYKSDPVIFEPPCIIEDELKELQAAPDPTFTQLVYTHIRNSSSLNVNEKKVL